MRIAAALLLLLASLSPLSAETDIWLFRGWGPAGFSTGIDQLGRKLQTLRGVGRVTVLDVPVVDDIEVGDVIDGCSA